uniref:Uncharacterized protein n=1 Tax=Meloidogyne incognita TaxID=6306 RepID=A0A914NID6_MELIC
EWLPSSIHLCAYHDCNSLANAWSLGLNVSSLHGPTGASQAQSPSEDDAGDGKSNDLLVSCPAFRNELVLNLLEELLSLGILVIKIPQEITSLSK